jgi:hypothetical protein
MNYKFFLLLISLILSIQNLFAQKNKLPEDLLTADVVLFMTCSKVEFEKSGDSFTEKLKSLGFKIVHVEWINEYTNPSEIKKRYEQVQENKSFKFSMSTSIIPANLNGGGLIFVITNSDKVIYKSGILQNYDECIQKLASALNIEVAKEKKDKSDKKKDNEISKVLPNDLKTEKVIFVKYGSLIPDEFVPTDNKRLLKSLERIDKQADEANPLLEKNLEKYYPFEYVLIDNSEIAAYRDKGYKYVVEERSNGTVKQSVYHGNNNTNVPQYTYTTQRTYQFYLKNLETDETYQFDIFENNTFPLYQSIGLITKVIKKQYGIK